MTIFEAKASARGLYKPLKTAEFFVSLRPDIALLAVMEAPSALHEAKFDEFSAALAGIGIEPKLWTLNEIDDFEDAPWFVDQVTRLPAAALGGSLGRPVAFQ